MATARQQGLTEQQQRALGARGVSVALSAGAGCGKTFVLTERFLRCLEPAPAAAGGGLRLDQLTAITFTERAAREMRDRIRSACAARLLQAPEAEVDHWLRLLRELDAARISTIHSFCGALLRAHAVEAGLDPRFRVLDQAQADTLLYELIDRQLRSRLDRREEAVLDLIVQFGLGGLRDMVRQLLAVRQEIDWPQWRGETADGLLARWQAYWRQDTLPRAAAKIVRAPAANVLLEVIRNQPPSHAAMRQRCEAIVDGLEQLGKAAAARESCSAQDLQAILAVLRENAKVQGGGGKKAWASEELYETFRDAASTLRGLIDDTQQRLAFDPEAARPAAEAGLRLLTVADEVAAAYEAEKTEMAVLDFNDLLIRARDLLAAADQNNVPTTIPVASRDTAAALRKRLAGQIKLLLVDEFQDTDPLQVNLVKAICDGQFANGKLFFVGDFKQSIYRFRGADPHVFQQLRQELPAAGRLPLSQNFRSQPAVLEFINTLFSDELGPEYEPLVPFRTQVAPTPAVEFLWATEPEPPGDWSISRSTGDVPADDVVREHGPVPLASPAETTDENRDSVHAVSPTERLRRLEADWIARRLRAMLDAGEQIIWDEAAARAGRPAARAVRPGDVALLFRALTNVEYYEEALRRHGIDYYLVGGHAFYAQQEIYDVVNLLRALANASDAVSLIGALRSPLFGLLDETLFWLGKHPEGVPGGLFAGRLPAELNAEQAGRVQHAAATLAELRAIKDRVPIAQLLQEALARTGYDAALLAEFLGQRKLANLRKLIDDARSFDQSGIFTLADFITQLSQFVARQPDEPLAATHAEAVDVVRLMTIHQSKGLEFPVVVIPDLDRPRRGPSGRVAFTPQLGPMIKDSSTAAASGYDLFWLSENDEEAAELVRLLYVATTRAADYLILSSGLPALGAAKSPWSELLGRHFDPQSGLPRGGGGTVPSFVRRNCDCPLPEGRGGPLVKVTSSEPPLLAKSVRTAPRPDLEQLVATAREMAAAGQGRKPVYLAAVPPHATGRQLYSFSRLRGTLHARPVATQVVAVGDDAATEPAALDPLGLGTLVHAVLADIDLARPEDVAMLVHRQAVRHLPDVSAGLEEPIRLIERLLTSPRGAAMAVAAEMHRELEFLLAWPPGSHTADGPCLQGFIDCLYRDIAGGWHLLDYKSNRAEPAQVAAVAAGYEMQMLVYALAAERILGHPPEELTLYFLRPGVEHRFSWDDAARQRAVTMVNEAMQLLLPSPAMRERGRG